MSSRTKIVCPGCQTTLKLKRSARPGRRVTCPRCGRPFVVGSGGRGNKQARTKALALLAGGGLLGVVLLVGALWLGIRLISGDEPDAAAPADAVAESGDAAQETSQAGSSQGSSAAKTDSPFDPVGRSGGFASPEAAFQAVGEAFSTKDWRGLTAALTPESQGVLAGSLIFIGGLSMLDEEKRPEIEALFEKHGLDLSGSQDAGGAQQSISSLAAPIADKPAFIAEMMNWIEENIDERTRSSGPLAGMAGGELTELQIRGDAATATVVFSGNRGSRPIEFRRVNGGWFVHLPEPELEMQAGSGRTAGFDPAGDPTARPGTAAAAGRNAPAARSTATATAEGLTLRLTLSESSRLLEPAFSGVVPAGQSGESLLFGLLELQGTAAQRAFGIGNVLIESGADDTGSKLNVIVPAGAGAEGSNAVPVVRGPAEDGKNVVRVPLVLHRPEGSAQFINELSGRVTLLGGGRRRQALVPLLARLEGPVLPAPLFRRAGLRIRLQRPSPAEAADPSRGVRVVVEGTVTALAGLEIDDGGERIDTSRSRTWDGRTLRVVLAAERALNAQTKLKVTVAENPQQTEAAFRFRRVALPGRGAAGRPVTSRPPKQPARPASTPPPSKRSPGEQEVITVDGEAPALRIARTVKLQEPENHGGLLAFAFSPDGQTVAGGTGVVTSTFGGRERKFGGEVVLWNARTGRLTKTLGGHGGSVSWLQFAPDGKTLVSASRKNGVIKVWQMPGGRLQHTLQMAPHEETRTLLRPLLALSPDGRAFASVTTKTILAGKSKWPQGGELVLWDLDSGQKAWSLEDSKLAAIAFSPDGVTLAGIVRNITERGYPPRTEHKLRLWNAATGEVTSSTDLEGIGWREGLAFLDDGQTLVVQSGSGLLQLDPQTGAVEKQFRWHKDRRGSGTFAVSPDGKTLGRAWIFWGLELVDLPTGQSQGVLLTPELPKRLWNVAFSPDLERVACTLEHNPVVVHLTGGTRITPRPPIKQAEEQASPSLPVRTAQQAFEYAENQASPSLPVSTARVEIFGNISVQGLKKGDSISVGCLGRNPEGRLERPGVWLELGGSSYSATSTTWEPRNSTLAQDRRSGRLTHRHVNRPPGVYLVGVRGNETVVDDRTGTIRNEGYYDWKWVKINENQSKVRVDLTVDPENLGTVEVSLPRGSKQWIVIYMPLDSEGKLPLPDALFYTQRTNSVNVEDDKAVIRWLRAGRYRIAAASNPSNPSKYTGRRNTNRTQITAGADVEVKRGATTKVQLVPRRRSAESGGRERGRAGAAPPDVRRAGVPLWTIDLSKMEIPEKQAHGILRGEPFVAVAPSFKSYPKVCILELRGSNRFRSIQVLMPPESANDLEAKRFRVSGDSASDGLRVNLNWPGEKGGREVPLMRTFREDYGMILEFGKKMGGRIPGRIYVCLPDKEHSVIAGTFTIAP